ncbi:MAG: branched-chain amino acid transport system II carrier protein [Alphaproteobacteria bacterium]|nr:MAG: branched-chain amino acid transport system II carrier protein [Alphaproteobacteria bacterium]
MNTTRLKKVLPAGFAFFSMLFGSGNLVYPLLIGQNTKGSYLFGMIGLTLSSIIFSFIGYVSIMSTQGDLKKYFSEMPHTLYFFMMLAIFLIIGPFLVIPRCTLVAFGGLKELFPNIELAYFALFYLLTAFFLSFKEEKVIDIIGKYLTPLKLGGILFVIFGALYVLPDFNLESTSWAHALSEGIVNGYKPMDLIGVLFFASIIHKSLETQLAEENNKDPKELNRRGMLVGLVGLSCIGIIYLFLLFLGAKYAFYTEGLDKELILPRITTIALGKLATATIAFTLFFATLATSVTLCNVFTDFFVNTLLRGMISRKSGLILTVVTSFVMTMLGFDFIDYLAGNFILWWLYPFLMSFVIFKSLKTYYLRMKST